MISWSLCQELILVRQLNEENDLVNKVSGKTIGSKEIIRILFVYMIAIHYYFDVMVIEGLARSILAGINLL